MNTQLLKQKEMLKAYINTGKCYEKDFGLCDNVLIDTLGLNGTWLELFETWPSFSGKYAYPVEGNCRAYCNNDQKHDRRTKYGKLRLSLAKHCLEYILKELEKSDG
jgi:hypothetical protein